MAPVNTFFKKHYTAEEISECMEWFQQRMDKLPATLDFGSAHVADLPHTIRRMLTVLRNQMNDKGTYNGQFSVLLQIRKILKDSGIEQ
ncbi:MAG: hypothetical protein IJT75_03380 [Bacteroidaceae bacterium]|nr:hypothetical protein [Bacteroidaceae bacterium]